MIMNTREPKIYVLEQKDVYSCKLLFDHVKEGLSGFSLHGHYILMMKNDKQKKFPRSSLKSVYVVQS